MLSLYKSYDLDDIPSVEEITLYEARACYPELALLRQRADAEQQQRIGEEVPEMQG